MHFPGCNISHLAVAASLALWVQTGYAAREEHTFEVSVSIPTHDFYVLPVDPGFVEREQQMNWNLVNGTLEPLRTLFDVRSTSGAVSARLGHEPVLSNGRDLIALNVIFNNQPLLLTNTVVVPDTEANIGSRVPLLIEAITPDAGFSAGEYFGSVQFVFDASFPMH